MYSQPNNSKAEKNIVDEISRDNRDTMKVFSEASRVDHDDDRKRLCAHTLFSSFTAEIINDNTPFTR